MTDYLRVNRQVYNAMADANDPLCRVATDAELADPLGTVDGAGWLGNSIQDKNLLCLAAGGGRQSSLYAAAGANVTVVDLSGAMLELDRLTASRRGFSVRLFETTMEDLSMFQAGEFDIVIHPVSTCYVPSIQPVYREVARVTAPGGIYVSQHKQPTSLQCSTQPNQDGHYTVRHAYYRQQPVPAPDATTRASRRLRETGAVEYLHRWDELIGGMCAAGFAIEALSEPHHADPQAARGSFGERAQYIAPYVRIKARRQGGGRQGDETTTSSKLWTPSSIH